MIEDIIIEKYIRLHIYRNTSVDGRLQWQQTQIEKEREVECRPSLSVYEEEYLRKKIAEINGLPYVRPVRQTIKKEVKQ